MDLIPAGTGSKAGTGGNLEEIQKRTGRRNCVRAIRITVFTDDMELYKGIENTAGEIGAGIEIPFEVNMCAGLKQMAEMLTSSPVSVALVDLGTARGKEAAEFLNLNDSGCSLYLLDKDGTHGLLGYQVGAKDFLIKPLQRDRLTRILVEEARRQSVSGMREIKIKIEGLWKPVPPASVLYVESMGHNLTFHMVSGKDIRFVATFKEYHPILGTFPQFLRCHQSYMLNLDYVTEMKSDMFRMGNGEEINISRQYRRECKQAYIEYMLKKYCEEK